MQVYDGHAVISVDGSIRSNKTFHCLRGTGSKAPDLLGMAEGNIIPGKVIDQILSTRNAEAHKRPGSFFSYTL